MRGTRQLMDVARIIGTGGIARGAAAWHSIGDARRHSRRRLPRMIFDFIDGGANDEVTLRANQADFSRITFRPRMLMDVASRDCCATVLGQEVALPVLLSPAGLLRVAHTEGELAVARAAGKAGTAFVVSTASSWSIEEVAEAAAGPLWFQLYLWRDREVIQSLVDRAKKAGYTALVVTVDLQIIGKRERDLHSGMRIPPKFTVRSAFDVVQRPQWFLDFLKGPPITFRNFVGIAEGDDTMSHSAFLNRHLINPSADWDDVDWLRKLWEGPFLLKGIMTVEDARRALDHGVDGIVVSNHGGRQLDGLPSAIRTLPDIVDAVDGRAEVILDGGVRRGSDVVKALALGARAVMTGRSWIWGLGAAGEAGVERVLQIFREEIDQTLALTGRPTLGDVDRSLVHVPESWERERPH
jgi:isopentenyl diphosphate isomerase/L-lactate dehydrogenase-like FMN-dependent dehydrogenase